MKAHGKPFDKEQGRVIIFVLIIGGIFDGFRSDIARVAVVGKASQQQKDLFKLLKDVFF
jgi:Xaa-Pro aminopeptidase